MLTFNEITTDKPSNIKNHTNRGHEWAAVTLFWCVLEGVFWGDSAAADGGNVRSVASRGERTISF